MYKRFYQLSKNPFRLAPEPDFCFSHNGYKRAREYLEFALAQGEGFVMVTGRPGTGKTLLVETFLKEINPREVIARRIAVSSFGATDLLRAVAYAYDIDAVGMDKGTMRHRIQQFFVRQEQAGRRVLLIIDEAQTLSHAALEELRILADLQTRSRLMLQLFLVGQESLQELMCTPDMEQFQQRVIANYQLVPLNLQETRSYIEHRLLQAGWKGDPEYSSAAVLSIYKLSTGVPRHINKICNRLLLLGFGKDKHAFDEQDVQEISAEMREERLTPLEINQAPLYDAENVTNISEVRDDQIAVTGLAIRVDKQDACPAAIPEGSLLAAQNMEAFFTRHHTPPVDSDEQTTAPDVEKVAPVSVAPELLEAANAPLGATPHFENVENDRQADRSFWKKPLTVAVMLLVLLTAIMVSVPSFPGHDGVRNMLSLTDHLPRWRQQIVALQQRLVLADVDSDIQTQAKGTVVSDDHQSVVGVINRQQAEAEVQRSVVDIPVRETAVAGVAGQTGSMQADNIGKLLAQGRQALDDYRLVTPEGDNAYEYLREVLQLEPVNETARAGIQEIVDIYITLAARAVDNNELVRAVRYLDRGLDIQSDNPELLALKDTVNNKMESATVTHETARAGRQLTRENTTLQKQPSLRKRQAADRRRDVNTTTGQGI
jgi:type II secretory pathway predicted ATPase ExeA